MLFIYSSMKRVVLTGCSRGIGFATAIKFLEAGHEVVAISRSESGLNALKDRAADLNGTLHIIAADITDEELGGKLSAYGAVDILIHNAGLLVNKPFEDITMDDLENSYRVNLFAPYRLTQSLLPHLTEQAHIIMISSVGGITGTQKFPGLSAYSSSKAALSALAECLHAEYHERGWTFNCLALGAVQTEMLEAAFPGYKAEVSVEEMADYIFDFAFNAPAVIRGKSILVSRSNP